METKLAKALIEFIKKYPSSTNADIQTFALGWQAAMISLKIKNLKL